MEILVKQVKPQKKENRFTGITARLKPFSSTTMGLILLIVDILSFILSISLAFFIGSYLHFDLVLPSIFEVFLLVVIIIIVYSTAGLYPTVGMNPVEELRLIILSTTGSFLLFGALSFYLNMFGRDTHASLGIAWIFTILLISIMRTITKSVFSAIGVWGVPVALIGYGEYGNRIREYLEDHPQYGYRPAVIINGFESVTPPPIKRISVQQTGTILAKELHLLDGIKTAICIPQDLPTGMLNEVIEGHWHKFHHIIIVSDDKSGGSAFIKPLDFGGMLGLKVQQNLSNSLHKNIKRFVDLFLILLALPFLLVIVTILSIMIRLESRGPIFYRQKRIGMDKKEFMIWKFRTMMVNADQILDEYLANHPEHKAEWCDTQKIKNDPRVTKVGKILRRLSLDELPQIYNIVRGEMSLVGPRPIVEDEIQFYGEIFKLYTRVKPGLTGLWQVSGRNDLTYDQRVGVDEYYVKNWSIWLDLYILTQTLKAMITGRGAY